MARNRPSFIVCTTSTQITGGVAFYTGNDITKGACLFAGNPATCASTVPGYSVTQNVTARTTTLHIDSVDCTRETGNWYCRHGDADTSSSVYIGCNTIRYSPAITSVPSNKDVVENTKIDINCGGGSSPGNPLPSYRWTGPDSYSRDQALLDRTVTRTRGGQYTCTATNAVGSDTAMVTINALFAPIITFVTSYIDVTENTSLNIDCSSNITPGNPSSTSYRWTSPGGYSKAGAVLDRTVSRTQGGQYTCTATNTAGLSDTAMVNINIHYKASIQSFTANSDSGSVIVDESTAVTLTCRIDSNPRSTIKLMYGSQELKREDNSLTASTTVRPSCRQRGDYSCTATNNIGTKANSVVKLAIKCYPRIDETSNVQDKYGSSVGRNVTVSVPVLAYPVPTFTWRRNTRTSQDLSGSFILVSDIVTNSVLQLTRIQQEDIGEYTLTAENGVGDPAVFTVTIVPQGPPETPTNLTVRPDGPHSLVVAWKQEFNGGVEQTFTVEYSMDKVTWTVAGTYVESQEIIYQQQTIAGLQPSTTYFVKVISRNELGEKKYTESVSGQTAQAIRGSDYESSNIGVIVGVTVGVVLVIITSIGIVVCLVRKGYRCVKLTPDTEVTNKRLNQGSRRNNKDDALPATDDTDRNHYSDLNRKEDKQTYTELKTYVNTEFGSPHGTEARTMTVYDGLQENASVPYETLNVHTYANT